MTLHDIIVENLQFCVVFDGDYDGVGDIESTYNNNSQQCNVYAVVVASSGWRSENRRCGRRRFSYLTKEPGGKCTPLYSHVCIVFNRQLSSCRCSHKNVTIYDSRRLIDDLMRSRSHVSIVRNLVLYIDAMVARFM